MARTRVALFAALSLSFWLVLLGLQFSPLTAPTVALVYIAAGVLPVQLLSGFLVWRGGAFGLSDLAYRDDLTGIGNRRRFRQQAQTMLRTSRAGGLALVLLDVNSLKQVNDACGHLAGDELLVRLTGRLAPAGGAAFRIGGDEFALLLDRSAGASLTETLKPLQPFAPRFTACGHHHIIALSVGYASNQESDDLDSLFRRADASLLTSKREHYLQPPAIDDDNLDADAPGAPALLTSLRQPRARAGDVT